MSSGLIFLFLILVFLIVGGIGILMSSQMPQHSRTMIRQVASALKGHASLQKKRQVVTFRRNRVPFRMTVSPNHSGKSKVRLSAPWPDPGLRIRLFPEQLSDELKRFLKMQDIKVGWKKFDDAFVIQSNSEADLIRLLTRPAQTKFLKLGDDVSVTVSGGTFAVDMVRSFGDATQFVQAANDVVAAFFKMYDRSFDSADMELVFVENEHANCMVCGDELMELVVRCSKCNTPHHRDCWDYLGMCSTYACGSKRSV